MLTGLGRSAIIPARHGGHFLSVGSISRQSGVDPQEVTLRPWP